MSIIQNYTSTYTCVAENGDVIRDIIRTQDFNDGRKIESVDRYINEIFISVTTTEFLNGYKHGYQRINKENGNGTSQNFVNYYFNGELQNNHT
jgi:hypothetical protein